MMIWISLPTLTEPRQLTSHRVYLRELENVFLMKLQSNSQKLLSVRSAGSGKRNRSGRINTDCRAYNSINQRLVVRKHEIQTVSFHNMPRLLHCMSVIFPKWNQWYVMICFDTGKPPSTSLHGDRWAEICSEKEKWWER